MTKTLLRIEQVYILAHISTKHFLVLSSLFKRDTAYIQFDKDFKDYIIY